MEDRIEAELHGIDLGDERLNRRSRKVLDALAANPQVSINPHCAPDFWLVRFFLGGGNGLGAVVVGANGGGFGGFVVDS